MGLKKVNKWINVIQPEKRLWRISRMCQISDIPSLQQKTPRRGGPHKSLELLRSIFVRRQVNNVKNKDRNRWTDMCTCWRKQFNLYDNGKVTRSGAVRPALILCPSLKARSALPLKKIPLRWSSNSEKHRGVSCELISDWYWPLEWLRNTSVFLYHRLWVKKKTQTPPVCLIGARGSSVQ